MGLDEGIKTSTCAFDCGARCLLRVKVAEGVVQQITTEKQPGPGLKACARGLAQREVLYAKDRLRYPLKRVGERGRGKFEPISWEEALDQIARELQKVKEQRGPQSVFLLGYSGSQSALHNTGRIGRRFFSLFGGCTATWGSTSMEAALFASRTTFGTPFTRNSRDNFLDSKLIVLWGWNPLETRLGTDTVHFLAEARRKGAKMVCIDPRLNPTGKSLGAQWIPLRPGTDTAMLLAMAHVLIAENLHDRRFIETYTSGFEEFHRYVMGREDGVPKTPAWAEAFTGVPASTTVELARDYGLLKPAALCTGWAPGRTAYGEQYHRAAAVLSAMAGNIGVRGGYVSGGADIMDKGVLRGWPVPHSQISLVHVSEVYDLLLQGRAGGFPNDIHVLYVLGCNLLNQWPNINKGIQALQMPQFMVVHELFMTPTARFADLVLPVPHFLEREDIGQPWGGGSYNIAMEKAVEPKAEVKSDLEIFTLLASRLGISGFGDKTEEEWLREFIPDYPQLKEERVRYHEIKKPWIAFQDQIENPARHSFPTPSGKIEIYSRKIAEMRNPLIPPIPKFMDPREGPRDPLAKTHPLQMVSPHSKGRVNSTLDNIPALKAMADDSLWLNPKDAGERKIHSGDSVRIFNNRGRMARTAKVTKRIMPGVVSLEAGSWYDPDDQGTDRGGCVNVVTQDVKSPAGASPYNSCLVQVERETE